MEPIKANGEPIKLNLVKAAICRFTPGLKRLLIEADCDCQLDGTVLIGALNDGRIELTAKRHKEPRLTLERVDVILREETAGRGIYPGSCELSDGSIYVSLLAQNDEAHRFTARNVTEETFREAVRNAVEELEKKSGKLTLERAKEITVEVAVRFGFYCAVFGVGPDKLKVTLINRNNHSESILPRTEEDDFRRAVIGGAKNLQDMSGPSDWLGYNRIREIVRMECAKEGVACVVAQRPGAEEIEVSDCFGSQYKFTWIGGSADTLREEVRNAILAMRQASNKLTPEKMWQIVQEVCATDGERSWMIKNDDGSIREIHAYGYKWTTFSLLAYTTEQFRKVVTDARDKRSPVRINLTNQSHAIDAAVYAMYRL